MMSRKSNPKGNKPSHEASLSSLETFAWPEEAAENRSNMVVGYRNQRAMPWLGPSVVSKDNSATNQVEYTVQWNQGGIQTSSTTVHQPENRKKEVHDVVQNGSRLGVQRNQVEYTVQWNHGGYQPSGTTTTKRSSTRKGVGGELSQHERDVESKRRSTMYSPTDGTARLWQLDQDLTRKAKKYGYIPEQRLHAARFYPDHSHAESSQTRNGRSQEVLMIGESETNPVEIVSRLDALVKTQQGNQYSRRSLWSRMARRNQDDTEVASNAPSSFSSLSHAETELSSIPGILRETSYNDGTNEQRAGARSEEVGDGFPKMWKSVSQIWDSASPMSRTNSWDPLSPPQDKTPSIRGVFPDGGEGGFWPHLETSDRDLMVAAIVEEDVDPFVIPAIEFDPDAKPRKPVQDNRFKIYVVICVAMVFVVVIVLSLGIQWTFETRLPGIPYRETIGIQENIEHWLNLSISDEPTDPYRQAFHWIVHEDPKQTQPADPTFQQRFILALFYFLTSQERDWDVDCAPLYSHVGSDFCRMNFHDFSIEKVGNNVGHHWLSAASECEWGGILCDGVGNVKTIRLEAAGLNSRLPSEELTKLPFLQGMLLGRNSLSGSIPEALSAGQKHLAFLELLGNKLSGALPSIPFRSIAALDIRDNSLRGAVTSSFTSSLNLKTFVVADNRLSGTFPERIGDGSSPHAIVAENNLFYGSIPAIFGTTTPGLETLRLENNIFSGTIPDGLGSQRLLKRISLGSNLLTGTIPKSFWSCSGCNTLSADKNKLTGTISASIGKAKKLVSIDVSGNVLNGTIPASMFTLPLLHSARLEGNNFTGEFPNASCAFQSVAFDSLLSMSADCRESSDGKVEIACPCCTVCCDSDGKNCLNVN